MFQWILTKKWLPEIIFGVLASVIFGTFDFIGQGTSGLIVSLLFSATYFFFRQYTYVSAGLALSGAISSYALGIQPTVAGFGTAGAIFLAGMFSNRLWGMVFVASNIAGGLFTVWDACFNSQLLTNFYGVNIYNEGGRWWGFAFAAITVMGLNGFLWLLGAFILTSISERTAAKERDTYQDINLRAMLDLAEQNERFDITRDLNELVMQRVSAILTLADGARYASKLEPEVAGRTLDRLVELIRGVHEEMRRMFDMLNKSVAVATTPPGISEIDALAAQYRELGYPTRLQHLGKRLNLLASAELNIYRIVFDALDNVREHAPIGTSIDVDFIWSENGLQVLVKDNGTEVAAKSADQLLNPEGYTAEDDEKALTEEVTGPVITGMHERAQLFQGSVEARRVPGIGFTLNAIFPGIDEYLADN
jgi:signal transduction histidine kinase